VSDDLRVETGDRADATITGGLDRLMATSAGGVFAEPVRVGSRVLIPVSNRQRANRRSFGRPVAVIEAGPDGVHVKPVFDVARIGLTLAAAAFTVWRAARR